MSFYNINNNSSSSSIYYNNYNRLLPSLIQSMKEHVLKLKELEAVRSLPDIKDLGNHLEQILWHKPATEKQLYRQARQNLLQLVGQAIESLAPTQVFNYPREFLDQIVLGLQTLKNLGFTEEAIQHLAAIYKPWSEEVLHYCEIGVHGTTQFSNLIALSPKEGEKIAKGQHLIHTFATLQTLLAEEAEEHSLTEALLNFDRAWWESLYLYYDPIKVDSLKELKIEIEKRTHQYVEQRFKALSMMANNKKILNESVKASEFLNPILETMKLTLDANHEPPTDHIPPLVASISKSHFAQEINNLFNDEKKEIVLQTEQTKQEDLKPIIHSKDLILEQPKLLVETPISFTSIVDIEKVIEFISPVIERTADYSHYQGRLADFINDHFEIIYKGTQVNDLSNVKEIYMTDIHFSMGYRTLYTALADLFTTSNSIIFAEAIKAMETCYRF